MREIATPAQSGRKRSGLLLRECTSGCCSCSVEFVQVLLGVGANINLLQGEHRTALRAAVLGIHEEVVNILIKYGTLTWIRRTIPAS